MKTIRFCLVCALEVERNSAPSPGTSPSSGTFCALSVFSSLISPPSTTSPWSSTITVVRISRLLVITSLAEALSAIDETSWTISMRTVLPSLICGLRRSFTPTSRRSIVWYGLVLLLVTEPVTKGTS